MNQRAIRGSPALVISSPRRWKLTSNKLREDIAGTVPDFYATTPESLVFFYVGKPIFFYRDAAFLTSEMVFRHISRNCGRGYDHGTAAGLYTVALGRQGHAPCKTSSSKYLHGSLLFWAPTSP